MSRQEAAWQQFIDMCVAVRSPEDIAQLLSFFFTAQECDQIASRVLIVKELISGENTQRQIAKEIDVSIAKITRGSNELKRSHPRLIALLSELLQQT